MRSSDELLFWTVVAVSAGTLILVTTILAMLLPRGMAKVAGTLLAIAAYVAWAGTQPSEFGDGFVAIWTPLVGFIAWWIAKSAAYVVETIRA